MRESWLASMLLVLGCFAESPKAGDCIEGEAACDCRPDGTCIAEHECIASIGKCVPNDCTPGSESCTCVDGGCLSTLVCDAGVCVPPSSATTGGDPSVASSLSETIADTGSGPTMSGPSDASTMTDSDPTIPPDDTSATDVSVSVSVSLTSDPSLTDASASVSDDTAAPSCPECIADAGDDVCEDVYNTCELDLGVGGCQQVLSCISKQLVSPQECCETTQEDMTIQLWNSLVDCAQDSACAGVCDLTCVVK